MTPALTFRQRQSSRGSRSWQGRGAEQSTEGPEASETGLCDSATSDRKSHIWQNVRFDSITDSTDVNLGKFQGIAEGGRAWHAAWGRRVRHRRATERSNKQKAQHKRRPSARLRVRARSLQPCLTLCDPTDCSPPGSSVRGILQARILEWVAMPSSRGLS